MKKISSVTLLLSLASALLLAQAPALASDDDSFAPGGTAIDHSTEQFHNLKVVMDLKAHYISDVSFGLMVAKRIMAHPGTKLIVVIEGPEVAMFAKKNYLDHQGAVDGWADLANKGIQVEFCGNSVHGAGLKPQDMDGLSESTPAVVNPGAYPTIAHYEQLGYALALPSPQDKPAQ
jgi:intracellular sulfur oxidation DsrE/DsrF family protein